MAYYGFEHRYGADVRDESGELIGLLAIFPNRADRDRWLRDGSPVLTNKGARTPLKSRAAARFRRRSAAVEVM